MITLIRGCSQKGMRDQEPESVNLNLGDLPYGLTGNKWDSVFDLDLFWKNSKRIRKKRAPTVLFGADLFGAFLKCSNFREHKFDWMWNKILKTGHLNAKKMPMGQHELISYFTEEYTPISVFGKGGTEYNPIMEEGNPQHSEGSKNKKRDLNKKFSGNYGVESNNYVEKKGNTLKYPSTLSLKFQKVHPSKCIHPTQKPLDLTEYLVNTHSKKGDLVNDPAAGVFTVPIACINTGRNCIAYEKDYKIFEDGRRRIEKHAETLDFDPDIRFIYT